MRPPHTHTHSTILTCSHWVFAQKSMLQITVAVSPSKAATAQRSHAVLHVASGWLCNVPLGPGRDFPRLPAESALCIQIGKPDPVDRVPGHLKLRCRRTPPGKQHVQPFTIFLLLRVILNVRNRLRLTQSRYSASISLINAPHTAYNLDIRL